MKHDPVSHVLKSDVAMGLMIIDGGHFTLRRNPGDSEEARQGGLFYFRTEFRAASHANQIYTARCYDDPTMRWSVCRIPAERVEDFLKSCPREPIHLSGPSQTEIETLRQALSAYGAARDAGQSARLRIMVGNLGLPAELRTDDSWVMPSEYRVLIDAAGHVRWRFIRESHCRNAGGRHAREKFKKLLNAEGLYDGDYADFGYGIVRIGAATLYVVADALLDQKGRGERAWALALTKDGTRPTCGVTLAGCLVDVMEQGATRYLAFHDRRDDTRIHAKIVEGVLIAAYLDPVVARPFVCEVHTLSGGEPYETDVIDFGNLAKPGVRESFSALLADTRRRMRKVKVEWTNNVDPTDG